MKEILCENPTNILNPHAQELLCLYGCFLWKGVLYELTSFQRQKLKYSFVRKMFPDGFNVSSLTIDELDSCQIVKPDGTTIPLVYRVPCNKCEVCEERKGKEWQTRCACESVYSTSPVMFVTNTYNSLYLPEDGVNKRDLQLYFKRLRKIFDNHGLEHDMRYFAVSEYGEDGRPHYHILFWNLPKVHIWKLIRMLEDAWSFEIDKSRYYQLKDYERIKRYELKYNRHARKKELVNVYRERIGIIKAELARDKSGSYCALYMGDKSNPLKYKNPTFYLASRGKGGLGTKWLTENAELYRTKSDMTSVELPNPNGKGTKHYRIPKFFINKWFPCRSQVVPKDVMDAYKLFSFHSSNACLFEHYLSNPNYIPYLADMDLETYYVNKNVNIPHLQSIIKEKYNFLPDLTFTNVPDDFYQTYDDISPLGIHDYLYSINCIKDLFDYLIDYQIDNYKLKGHLLKEKRSELIQANMTEFESLPLNEVKIRIKDRKILRQVNSKL